MNYDDLQTLKLKMVQILADRPGGLAPKGFLQTLCRESFGPDMEFYDEVLTSLVNSGVVWFHKYDVESRSQDVYKLAKSAKTKYGITIKPYYTYIPQHSEPPKYVNIVNSAGVIVGTKEVMSKGDFRKTLAGICIVTIIGILVAIFIFL